VSEQKEDLGKRVYWLMNFRPNVELISVVRRFVSEFYDQILGDKDATSRVAMATHELLENAVKYSSDGETSVCIDIVDEGGQSRINIRIGNRAKPEQVELVRTAFQEMQDMPDPDEYYQMVMRRSAKRTDRSGLGLARVRAEGEMTMACEIQEENKVTILAQTKIDVRLGAA
jgi:anti-sigma regulatory factor (Ser/Thr protein kinase)